MREDSLLPFNAGESKRKGLREINTEKNSEFFTNSNMSSLKGDL